MVGPRNIFRVEMEIGGLREAAALDMRLESYYAASPPCTNPNCPWGFPVLKRNYPGTFEFQNGTVYDFISGIGTILALKQVAADLCEGCSGVLVEPILLKKAKGLASIVLPEIQELRMVLEIPLNTDRSTVHTYNFCNSCGRVSFDAVGVEALPHEEKVGDDWVMVPHRLREPGKGIILQSSEVDDCDFFRYGGRYNLCTERAKNFVESRGWTNIYFLEYGEIIDG